jgi:uncharacterized protein
VRNEVFLDTNYAVALAADSDQLHRGAVRLADEVAAIRPRIITTQAVLLEIGNSLRKRQFRLAATQILSWLSADPNVEIVLLTEELYLAAFRLFQDRSDKQWSLTDCVSFVVMAQRDITDALTSDQHFEQAGYRALLLEK